MTDFFQTESCVINGHCFDVEEVNPENWCDQCRPGTNIDAWSINEGTNKLSIAFILWLVSNIHFSLIKVEMANSQTKTGLANLYPEK